MTRAIKVRQRPARRAGEFPLLPRPDELSDVPGDARGLERSQRDRLPVQGVKRVERLLHLDHLFGPDRRV